MKLIFRIDLNLGIGSHADSSNGGINGSGAPSSFSPSLLIVVDGVVYVFLCIVERHESVAVRAKAGAVAVAKDEIAAAGKHVRCLVADQIDRVAVEDFVSGRGLHKFDSVDSLSLEVVWPTNSYRDGATS